MCKIETRSEWKLEVVNNRFTLVHVGDSQDLDSDEFDESFVVVSPTATATAIAGPNWDPKRPQSLQRKSLSHQTLPSKENSQSQASQPQPQLPPELQLSPRPKSQPHMGTEQPALSHQQLLVLRMIQEIQRNKQLHQDQTEQETALEVPLTPDNPETSLDSLLETLTKAQTEAQQSKDNQESQPHNLTPTTTPTTPARPTTPTITTTTSSTPTTPSTTSSTPSTTPSTTPTGHIANHRTTARIHFDNNSSHMAFETTSEYLARHDSCTHISPDSSYIILPPSLQFVMFVATGHVKLTNKGDHDLLLRAHKRGCSKTHHVSGPPFTLKAKTAKAFDFRGAWYIEVYGHGANLFVSDIALSGGGKGNSLGMA